MEPTEACRRAYAEWMSIYPWEAEATLTFRYPRVSEVTAQKMLRKWCRENAKANDVRIACKGDLNFEAGNPHIHLLMLARSRRTGKTLLDLNLNRLADEWPATACVKPIRDAKAYATYVFVNNTRGRHLLVEYGTKGLNNLIRRKV